MNQNIEIKAKSTDFSKQREIAEQISDSPLEILKQEDTFFAVKSGRLKLREFSENRGELIFYRRANSKHAQKSKYRISPTQDPKSLKKILIMTLGVVGVVQKTRHLFHYGQTRIHLDEVRNLGNFIEFEYVLKSDEGVENAQNTIFELMQKLEINEDDLVSDAYIDLLLSH